MLPSLITVDETDHATAMVPRELAEDPDRVYAQVIEARRVLQMLNRNVAGVEHGVFEQITIFNGEDG